MSCEHKDFSATVVLNRFEDQVASLFFMVDLRVQCRECGEQFVFVGVPAGHSHAQPMVSADGLELRAPIEPRGHALANRMRFELGRES